MNPILRKLRQKEKTTYLLYFICNFFSVSIISSYALMMFSSTVLTVLPVGGDSRKQAFGIFAAVCIGCILLNFYSTFIFIKKKSKELGIMLSLGATKKKLFCQLSKEALCISATATILGILSSFPLNKGIWGIFQLFIHTEEMTLNYNYKILIISIGMGLIILLTSICTLKLKLNSLNLLDIMNAEHKNEMTKPISKNTGKIGILLTILGGIVSYEAPCTYMDLFQAYPPAYLNLLYIIPLVGVYLILLHSVVNGFGSSKKSHYNNMISRSMLKFQGKQTVNSMLVITLLIGGGCFAGFYTPVMMSGFGTAINNRTYDYAYIIPNELENEPENDLELVNQTYNIKEKANRYDITILDEKQIDSIVVAIDGTWEIEEGRKYHLEYTERLMEMRLIKESDYRKLTNESINIEPGKYYPVTDSEESTRSLTEGTVFTNMTTRQTYSTSFGGFVHFEDLIFQANESTYAVISDNDYANISNGMTNEWQETIHFLNVNNDSTEFADDLYENYYSLFNEKYLINSAYDYVSANSAYERREEYWADVPEFRSLANYDKNNAEFKREWKYYPFFKCIQLRDTINNYAVFILLFFYVSIICIASALLIGYTRCLTIGEINQYVYHDLEKLGSSYSYRLKILKKQLTSVYKTPAIVGITAIYFLFTLILYGNDSGKFTHSELIGLAICISICIIVSLIIYIIYRISVRKVRELI